MSPVPGWRETPHNQSERTLRAVVSRALFDPPAGKPITRRAYWAVAPYVYRWRYPTDFDDSPAAPDPFKLERVTPERITRFTRRCYPPWRHRHLLFGAVMNGGWDRRSHAEAPKYGGPPEELYQAETVEGSLLYQGMERHFLDGVPWEETTFVQRACEHVEHAREGESIYQGCTSTADVLERCEALDGLYRSMERRGCLSYRKLTSPAEREKRFLDAIEEEIIVDVGRDGTLFLVSGRHRLCMAHILGLEEIPVCFLVRHADWMDTRRAIANGTEEYWDHPDLRDLMKCVE